MAPALNRPHPERSLSLAYQSQTEGGRRRKGGTQGNESNRGSLLELCRARRAELEGYESSHIRHGGWLPGQTQYCGEWLSYRTALDLLHRLLSKAAKQGWKTTKNRDAQLELLPKL